MSGHKLRNEKNCLNCGHTVEDHFCSHCGQENIEPRQPFHYLFTHFFEDLTHYDGQVWKTFRFLLFYPGRLTREFLMGRRMRYVPPVRLYIFMSFIAFLLPALLFPSHELKLPELTAAQKEQQIKILEEEKATFAAAAQKPGSNISSKEVEKNNKSIDREIKAVREDGDFLRVLYGDKRAGIHTTAQLDSLQKTLPVKEQYNWLEYKLVKKDLELEEQGIHGPEAIKKVNESVFHNLPKALFLYMPLFAFWLWLFHGKKKWWYFDHGIFTLHYFSLLLTLITILYLVTFIGGWLGNAGETVRDWLIFLAIAYGFFYFFRSHSKVYQERKLKSRLKGIFLFFLNIVFMAVFAFILYIVSFLNLH
ncbi:DUF3667 domain-containing protein [Niabella sp.]|uniref:DUF3667 domain-containing protein n=1 Tax=Niabella sp. TaxID=1962976 RepID=UPI002623B4B7|nr:DUF3667 domain-containing protein [Niabella sp.]